MKNYIVFFFALIGISVLLGAFGSHFIYQITEDGNPVSTWVSTSIISLFMPSRHSDASSI